MLSSGERPIAGSDRGGWAVLWLFFRVYRGGRITLLGVTLRQGESGEVGKVDEGVDALEGRSIRNTCAGHGRGVTFVPCKHSTYYASRVEIAFAVPTQTGVH